MGRVGCLPLAVCVFNFPGPFCMQISSVIYPRAEARVRGEQERHDGVVYVWRVASLGRVPVACVDEVFATTAVVENLMESSPAVIQAQSVFGSSSRPKMIDAKKFTRHGQRAVSTFFNRYFHYLCDSHQSHLFLQNSSRKDNFVDNPLWLNVIKFSESI